MSEVERRQFYATGRVLIESSRVLTPTFAPQGVYLTGAQVEMLRNITDYLGRQNTFVDEYFDTYYEMATTSDWDTIQALVADLEDKLMSAENTPWGYNEGWTEEMGGLKGSDGAFIHNTTECPAGVVRVLQGLSIKNQTGSRGTTLLRATDSTRVLELQANATPQQYMPDMWSGKLVLKEGDQASVFMDSCLNGDFLVGAAWGYEMIVPD